MGLAPHAASSSASQHPAAPDVRVRRAMPRDLGTVVKLRLELLREHTEHPIYGRLRADARERAAELFGAQLLSDAEVMFLAESGEEIVGILRCVESIGSPLLEPSRYVYVSSAYVRPAHRRRGVLRALLREADAWGRARGLDEMRLHNVAGSGAAEGAWGALGFDVVEQVRSRRLPGTD